MDFSLGLDAIYGLATSQGWTAWISIGINLILSTIIGGIILAIILGIISKAWKESVSIPRAFLVVLIINIITQLGIPGLIATFIPIGGTAFLVTTLLIWIVLIKLFFGQMRTWHAVVVGIIGYVISLILMPNLVAIAASYIPF